MSVLNPMMLALLKQGDPRMVVQQIIQTNYPNDPMMRQLYQMGANNDTQGLQQFARQFFSQQGRDFDTEYNNLLAQLKNMR